MKSKSDFLAESIGPDPNGRKAHELLSRQPQFPTGLLSTYIDECFAANKHYSHLTGWILKHAPPYMNP